MEERTKGSPFAGSVLEDLAELSLHAVAVPFAAKDEHALTVVLDAMCALRGWYIDGVPFRRFFSFDDEPWECTRSPAGLMVIT